VSKKPRSKANGEGTIYKRKDGSYASQYHYIASEGSRKRRTLYAKSREEAASKLADALSERNRGLMFDGSVTTLDEYMQGYLTNCSCRVRPKTHRRYCDLYKCHIEPALGRKKLSNLKPHHLRAVYRQRLDAGLSPRTVAHAHVLLKQVLRQAVADGLIPRNPAEAVRPPKATKKTIRPLTPSEVRRMLSAATGDRWEALYVVAVSTGLRQGELLGLAWSDIDLDEGVLRVRHTLAAAGFPKGSPAMLSEPKTPRSRRSVRLPTLAVEALREHKVRQDAERAAAGDSWEDSLGSALVFPNIHGGPVDYTNVMARSYKPLLKRAGLPPIRFHDLRHTCATLLLSKGVHPKVVADVLGHASVTITLDTYSHVTPGLGDAAAGAMDDVLGD
jgi:integrase